MSEAFLKYDENNPPAGVDERGVFRGGGGGTVLMVHATLGDEEENRMSITSLDVPLSDIVAAFQNGRTVTVVAEGFTVTLTRYDHFQGDSGEEYELAGFDVYLVDDTTLCVDSVHLRSLDESYFSWHEFALTPAS